MHLTHHILHHCWAPLDADHGSRPPQTGVMVPQRRGWVPATQGQSKSLSHSAFVLSCLRDLVTSTALGKEVDPTKGKVLALSFK